MESTASELVILTQQLRQLRQLLDQLEQLRAAYPGPPNRSEWSGVSRLAFDGAHSRLEESISSAIASISRARDSTGHAVAMLMPHV